MNPANSESVRAAIARGDCVLALDLWNRYRATLAQEALTAESLAEALALVRWGRPLLLGVREHCAARLRTLHIAGVYRAPASRRSTLLRASL
ncbi:MAG TPA: hypothetical protein VMH28_19370 [Candidatus Acidoferrales bacterium]|nr:hypothetical protein [Candidatus Acidoferrales bacterium]